jgi:hypothetical protein
MPTLRQLPDGAHVPIVSYGFAVPEILRITTAVVGLLIAAWGLYSVWRNRLPQVSHLVGIVILEILAIALVATAVVRLASGDRAHEMVTFIGYLVAFLIIPPAGLALARMEPTKWGSAIIAAAGLVEAILVVRLQQVWTGIG